MKVERSKIESSIFMEILINNIIINLVSTHFSSCRARTEDVCDYFPYFTYWS